MATTYKNQFGVSPVTPDFWFLKAPLYHAEDYRFEKYNEYGFDTYRQNLMAVIFPKITIDVFCVRCGRETVFVPTKREPDWSTPKGVETVRQGVSYAHFECSRGDCKSPLYFVFNIRDGVMTKIGQLPSIADLVKPELEKYRKVLTPEQLGNWQRAVGLRAHGVGAGSYVYLRRIVEQLIEDARARAGKAVDDEAYKKSRWPERIKLLASYLPAYLVENAVVYGVLSKGVHELTEEECANFFDVMHTSMELICEDKLVAIEREEKAKAGTKALQQVLQSLARKDPA
jgi:hypothetical protein